MSKLTKPLFEKIIQQSRNCNSHDEYTTSIVKEIQNILSCRIKSEEDGPFNYGIKDWFDFVSNNELDELKKKWRQIIKKLEPRISEIEIVDLQVNNLKQTLELTIECITRQTKQIFYSKIYVGYIMD